jgi:hypothetical protein
MSNRKPSEKPTWPKHADGRDMRMSEMTPQQKTQAFRAAAYSVGEKMQASGEIEGFTYHEAPRNDH